MAATAAVRNTQMARIDMNALRAVQLLFSERRVVFQRKHEITTLLVVQKYKHYDTMNRFVKL